MTNKDYEQKKRECWEEFCIKNPAFNDMLGRKIFNQIYDRAYALGKQEKDAEEISSLEDEIHIYAKAYSFTVEDYTAIRKAVEFGVSLAESDADAVIQGWVARDSNSDLFIYNYKPKRDTRWDSVEIWNGETYIELDSNLFPDLTWDSDPLEVEIIIKRKNNGTTTSPKLQME